MTKNKVQMFQVPVERIEFDDGHWWEIYTEPTRGMRKRLREASSKNYTIPKNADVNFESIDDVRKYILAHPECLNLDVTDDVLLLVGTSDWSFDLDITVDSLDKLPDRYTDHVLGALSQYFALISDENLVSGDVI